MSNNVYQELEVTHKCRILELRYMITLLLQERCQLISQVEDSLQHLSSSEPMNLAEVVQVAELCLSVIQE